MLEPRSSVQLSFSASTPLFYALSVFALCSFSPKALFFKVLEKEIIIYILRKIQFYFNEVNGNYSIPAGTSCPDPLPQ